MVDFILAKSGTNTLVPVDEAGEKVLASLGVGEMCEGKHVKTRNLGNHRRYFEFIRQSFDMQDEYKNTDIWRKYLQVRAGHFDTVINVDGNTVFIPKSVDWASLDEHDFSRLFGEVVQAACESMPVNDEQLRQLAAF